MPVHYDKDKGRWRFRFRRKIAGQRYRASRLLPAAWGRTEAEKYDREEIGRIVAVATGVIKPSPTISEAVKLYLDHRCPQLKNGKKAAQDLAYLVPHFDGKTLDELPDISRQYVAENPKLAPATLRNRLAYLKAAVRYAYRHHGLGDRNYTERMTLPTVRNDRQVYAREPELRRLLAKCVNAETRAVITLAFYTGLRWRSEILTLNREQIIRERGQAWLSIPDTKTGSPHMIPVHPAAEQALKAIPFQMSDSFHFDRFWEAREAAGMPNLHMHDLRHSLASALISSGATLAEVGRALNHKSAISTRRYSHLYPERVRELILRLPGGRKVAHRKGKRKAASGRKKAA